MHAEVENPAHSDGDDAQRARLSVVLVARGQFPNVHKIVECLLKQSAAPSIEFILSTDSAALLGEMENFVVSKRVFARSRFLLDQEQNLARAARFAAAEARGDVVAFVEDHSFPSANWGEELLAAFDSSEEILAAAPVMLNPNTASAISRAQFLLFHGAGAPGPERDRFLDRPTLPWHNTAYRRNHLHAAARDDGMFMAEIFLQEGIRANHPRARFVRCTRCSVQHVNMSLPLPALRHAFHGGRIFAAERCQRHGWNPYSRAARASAFPVVALLKIRRSIALLRDHASLPRTLANFATAFPLAFVHAFGEACGTCFGKGRSHKVIATFEVDRGPLLRAADLHHLWPKTDFTPASPAAKPASEEKPVP